MKKLIHSLFIILVFSSCAFSKKQSKSLYQKAETKAPYDAIIVPGVPFEGETWSPIMRWRVFWSYYLYKNGITKNIIYSGGSVYTEYTEAKIMAAYGKALGIPASNIFLDTLAEHSSENVYYSYLVAKKNGFKKIALATDPFQSKLVKGLIRKLELPIDLIPFTTDLLGNSNYPEPSINPEVAMVKNFVSIKERESFFKRLKGTLGKQIIYYEEDLPNERMRKKFRKKGRVRDE